MPNKSLPLSVWIAFVGISIIWGTTFLGIKIALNDFPPFMLSAIRHLLAGIIFLLIFYRKGMQMPTRRDWLLCFVNGTLLITFGNGFVCWAETLISSGMAAVICAMTPLYVTLMSIFFFKGFRLNFIILIGLLLGIGGIVLLSLPHLEGKGGELFTGGAIMVTMANLMWALGSIFIKKHPLSIPTYIAMGIQMLFGGINNLMISFAIEPSVNFLHISLDSLEALIYLVGIGSLGGYGCYMYVLKNMTPARASIHTYINTVVAVLVGWLFYKEHLDLQMWISMFIVMSGVLLVNRQYAKMAKQAAK
jgi:drug/metabolite transporter (DMT)-like permease